MKDIRLNISFWDHWKTISLKERLGLEAIESLQRLWCFAAANKPDGQLSGLSATAIEMACRWTGKPGTLVEALLELRFLDKVGSCYALHDWREHNAFVATFPERSVRAKKAISRRWDTGRNTSRITKRNTPSPSPTPIPSPTPTKRIDQQFLDSMKVRFPGIDVETEWQDCQRWYSESRKKMVRPQSCLVNWLKKAKPKESGEEKPYTGR